MPLQTAAIAFLTGIALCIPASAQSPTATADAAGSDAATPPGFNAKLESSSSAPAAEIAEPAAPEPAPRKKSEKVYREPVLVGATPFSSFAVQVKLAFGGIGMDIATPLASRLNLRVGGTFFTYNPALVEDGINIVGDIELQTVSENFDFFPFGNSFRVSPGIVFYNGNHINAAASVPGGQHFSLAGGDYYSDIADPVHGTFDLAFGNQLAPSLTIGGGNMIPRKGGHWSVPFEIGAEYLGRAPKITLALSGSACQYPNSTNCSTIAGDPETMQNLQTEQDEFNSHIPSGLRFFPIISLGLAYKFGHH